ncbi:hypothetical protein [Dyadobacter sp. NIV53]|uniref:hypothetical protein n=1 Tax=Dyadobacter sp. NIV53 TaxID=2861765 RepID=UPI001C869D7B|nr:hypothetical protein [Dyadobacter sp. NIV53]
MHELRMEFKLELRSGSRDQAGARFSDYHGSIGKDRFLDNGSSRNQLKKNSKVLSENLKSLETNSSGFTKSLYQVYGATAGIIKSGVELGININANLYGIDKYFSLTKPITDQIKLESFIYKNYQAGGDTDMLFKTSSSLLLTILVGSLPIAGPVLAPIAGYIWEEKFAVPTYKWLTTD